MPAEKTALRFLPAAPAQFRRNGSFAPLFRASAMAAMQISAGAPRRARGRRQGLDNSFQKPCAGAKPETLAALVFKGSGFAPHAVSSHFPGFAE